MNRLLRIGMFILAMLFATLPAMLPLAQAQDLDDIFNFNSPVEYDQDLQIGRSFQNPDSIDSCLLRKQYFFNEIHNIWVEGLVRCEYNSKRVLSRSTFEGVSTDAADEQACVGKREGQIIVHGVPSEDEAQRWSERCAYLGTIGGAGPIGSNTNTNSNFSQFFSTGTSSGSSTYYNGSTGTSGSGSVGSGTSTITITDAQVEEYLAGQGTDLGSLSTTEREELFASTRQQLQREAANTRSTPNQGAVYTGPGVQVPDESLVASGISREDSLIDLIVFYTNATLPYVSVISVFVFVAAGLFYILSFTNEELNSKAKSMMMYVVIGIVIIFSAYTVVNTLLSFASFQ